MILFQLGQTIKDENGSGSVVVITSGQESQMSYQEKVAFEVFLPLNQKQVRTMYIHNTQLMLLENLIELKYCTLFLKNVEKKYYI